MSAELVTFHLSYALPKHPAAVSQRFRCEDVSSDVDRGMSE